MFKLVVALSACCLFSSCSSFAWKNSDTIRIESENQILKKKLLQVERRNQIIEDENSGCRKDLADSNTRNESLVAEVRSTNEARANESRMWQQKYDNLQARSQIAERESSAKIRDLTDLNRKQEEAYQKSINDLNAQMLAKDARYSQDTENLKKTAAEREFNLSNQMDEIKKESLARAEAVSRLEEKVKELGLAIEKLSEQNIKLSAENEKLKKLTDSHTHEIPEVAGGTR